MSFPLSKDEAEAAHERLIGNQLRQLGFTDASHFCFLCSPYLIGVLIELGLDIERKNGLGNTPLIYCAKNDYKEGLRCLLSLGANVHAKNHQNETALDCSLGRGYVEGALLLLQHDATLAFPNRAPFLGLKGICYLLKMKILPVDILKTIQTFIVEYKYRFYDRPLDYTNPSYA